MNARRDLLIHFLARLAYRTQKALRGAPLDFGSFEAGADIRSPSALVCHLTSVLGYARTYFIGGPIAQNRYHAYRIKFVDFTR